MICNCCKDLGCFIPEQTIDFGLIAVNAVDPYIFHIWCNGSYTTQSATFDPDEQVVLPFTFNENSETTIKIQFPADFIASMNGAEYGINFATTKDGACCFTVHGTIPIC